MSQRQKREHKKRDDARRSRARRHPTSDTCPLRPEGVSRVRHGGAAALAAAAVIAAGTSAYASPVRFDNPAHGDTGHFHYAPAQGDGSKWLGMTLPAESQPAPSDDLTALQQWKSSDTKSKMYGAYGGAQVEQGGFYDNFVIGVNAGELIPSGAVLDGIANIYWPGYGSELPEGVETYVGVRFDPGDGWHYGWIGVERNGITLDAFAWGYESVAGEPVPAGAPEPGTLALLAFGAGALLRRRRGTGNAERGTL